MPEPSLARIPTTHKTYKNKINHNSISNKADLWDKINQSFNIFNGISESNQGVQTSSERDGGGGGTYREKEPIECIYRSAGQREICDTCNSPVSLSDEGFLICTNSKCSIIYKDNADMCYVYDSNEITCPKSGVINTPLQIINNKDKNNKGAITNFLDKINGKNENIGKENTITSSETNTYPNGKIPDGRVLATKTSENFARY